MTSKKVMCVGLNGHTKEVEASDLRFRPSVYGVIVCNGKVLLSSQWDGWDFPGGGMCLGETIEETFVREVKEETGVTAKPGALLHVGEQFFTHPNTEEHFQTILFFYGCSSVEGDITTEHLSKSERAYVREAQWIPLDTVQELKFYNSVDSVSLIKKASEHQL